MAYTIQYYDLVLAAVITPLLLGITLGSLTQLSMPVAIIGLGLISIAVIFYALFVNGPVEELQDLTEEVDELV